MCGRWELRDTSLIFTFGQNNDLRILSAPTVRGLFRAQKSRITVGHCDRKKINLCEPGCEKSQSLLLLQFDSCLTGEGLGGNTGEADGNKHPEPGFGSRIKLSQS